MYVSNAWNMIIYIPILQYFRRRATSHWCEILSRRKFEQNSEPRWSGFEKNVKYEVNSCGPSRFTKTGFLPTAKNCWNHRSQTTECTCKLSIRVQNQSRTCGLLLNIDCWQTFERRVPGETDYIIDFKCNLYSFLVMWFLKSCRLHVNLHRMHL